MTNLQPKNDPLTKSDFDHVAAHLELASAHIRHCRTCVEHTRYASQLRQQLEDLIGKIEYAITHLDYVYRKP